MSTAKKLPLALLLLLFLSSCAYNEYVVESDYSYAGKFKTYKSFGFVSSADPNGRTDRNPIIEDAISYRLELMGYKLTDKKPDLLVNYKIFYGDFNFKGYDQPSEETWLKIEDENQQYDPVNYMMKRGSLLILMYDLEREEAVWQGYASGIFNDENLQDERYIRRAVRTVFDRYKFFAQGFMSGEGS